MRSLYASSGPKAEEVPTNNQSWQARVLYNQTEITIRTMDAFRECKKAVAMWCQNNIKMLYPLSIIYWTHLLHVCIVMGVMIDKM